MLKYKAVLAGFMLTGLLSGGTVLEVAAEKPVSFSAGDDKYQPVRASRPPGENFTVSAWLCPDGIPAGIEKFAILGRKNHDLTFSYTRDKRFELDFRLQDGKRGRSWSVKLPSDRWYHIAGVCDGAAKTVRFYVNGRMHHRDKLPAAPALFDAEFNLGCSDPAAEKAYWYNGLAGGVRIDDRAFSDREVEALFQKESGRYPVLPVPESAFSLPKGKAGFVLLPPFADDAVSEKERARLKEEIPLRLEEYQKKIGDCRSALQARIGDRECIQKERIGKRAEIVDNLVTFIQHNLARGDRSGLLFAASGVEDLKLFLKYFELEGECWEAFPRPAEGADPGNAPSVFNVRDFGAKGDGVTDDYAAFDRAVAAMKALGGKPSILRIPAGTYFFNSFAPADRTPAQKGGCHWRIMELENAVVEGDNPENTKFIFGRFHAAGVFLYRCRNVTIRNLTVQYRQTPFLQGTILEVDVPNSTVTVQHDPGTLTPDDPSFKQNLRFQRCLAYTPEGDIVRSQFIVFNERKSDDLGGGKYRIHMDKRYSIKHLRAGLKFIIPNREGEYPCFPFGDSTLCTAENIHIRNTRAASFQTWGGWWCTWTRNRIYPLPGMHLASNADALICAGGSYMSNCDISNLGDDCFNAFEGGRDVTRAEEDSAVYPRMPGASVPGNQLKFVSSATGQYLALATIKQNDGVWKGQTAAVFEEPLPPTITSRENGGRKELTPVQKDLMSRNLIRYEEALDSVYDTHQWGIGTVVSGNRFRHGCSGVNIQAACALVENNSFENFPMGIGLAFSALIGIKEGPAPYCVTARNNTMKDVHYGVRTHSFVQNMELARCAPVRGILFENNRIEDAVWPLLLRNTGDSVFRNNTITGKAESSFGEKSNRVFLKRCSEVTLAGNTLNGRPLTAGNVETEECEGSISVR